MPEYEDILVCVHLFTRLATATAAAREGGVSQELIPLASVVVVVVVFVFFFFFNGRLACNNPLGAKRKRQTNINISVPLVDLNSLSLSVSLSLSLALCTLTSRVGSSNARVIEASGRKRTPANHLSSRIVARDLSPSFAQQTCARTHKTR